jgi:hypothetical protein
MKSGEQRACQWEHLCSLVAVFQGMSMSPTITQKPCRSLGRCGYGGTLQINLNRAEEGQLNFK